MLPGAQAATFTVNSTADVVDATPGNGVCATASSACTLRAAIQESNASSGPDVITVPTGTYTLTMPGSLEDAAASGDLDITDTVTINGAGPTFTIIQAGTNDTNGIDKVFSVNQTGTSHASATFNGVTVRFGRNTNPQDLINFSHLGGGIDFFGASGTPTVCGTEKLTITNSVIANNSVDNTVSPGVGAGVSADNGDLEITNLSIIGANETTNQTGGGISHTGGGCTFTMSNSTVQGNIAKGGANGEGGGIFIRQNVNGTVMIHGSVIQNNTSESRGGGIKLESTPGPLTATIDQGTVISGNTSLGTGTGISEGGGLDISALGASTTTLQDVTITLNHADDPADGGGKGGGIFHNLGTLNASLSRITGNTAPLGSGLFVAAGTVTAENNWWGCDGFPNATGCDTVSGTASVNPRLDLVVTASPTTIGSGDMSTVTADVSKNSNGAAVNPVVLNGLPITFSATKGDMVPTPVNLASLMATSTYTNTGCPGDTASAKLDNGTATTPITINCNSDLAITKTDAPDPVIAGDNITYTINFSNGGPNRAFNATVTDAVPTNTTFVSAAVTTGTGWTITQPTVGGTGNVVFSKTNVASSETAVFQIVVNVNAGTTADISNSATAASDSVDPPGNNTGTATTTVSPPPTTTTTSTTTTTTTMPPPTTTTSTTTTTTTTMPPGVTCNGLPATIVGTPGNNTITGTSGNDVIVGLGGNDTINGGNGDDVICGGDGNDTLNGNNGIDRLFGENSNDVLNGNNGNDALDGGPQTDVCNGGNGSDTAASCEGGTSVP